MRVYGKNVAKEILQKTKTIKKAYIYENFNDNEILEQLKKAGIPCKFLDKKALDDIEEGNHQGIILEIDDYKYTFLDELLDRNIITII